MRGQRRVALRLLAAAAVVGFGDVVAQAATTWQGVAPGTFVTATNWTNGLPSTGPQLAIFDAAMPGAGGGTLTRTLDLAATARVAVGLQFNAAAGTNGFLFDSASGPGFSIRTPAAVAGVTPNAIDNLDDATQTFNVPVKLFTNGGGGGGSQTWNAGPGGLVFTGTHGIGGTTVDINGNGTLTITGAGDTTIGSAGTARGSIAGSSAKLTKSGAGTLTFGGQIANTYNGLTTVTDGTLVLNKPTNVTAVAGGLTLTGGTVRLGAGEQIANSSDLTLAGGTLDLNGKTETLDRLELSATSTIDFGDGDTVVLTFVGTDGGWAPGAVLNVVNWDGIPNTGGGTERFNVGVNGSSLTPAQVAQIRFIDPSAPLGYWPAALLDSAEVVAVVVPEPSTVALMPLAAFLFRRQRRD